MIAHHRHLDLRLPSDEPVATLLPQIRRLVFDGAEDSRDQTVPTILTTSVGEAFDAPQTLRGAEVQDGALLYLRNQDSVPPSPEVYDVASFVAESTHGSPLIWKDAHRAVGLAAVGGTLLGVSGIMVVLQQPSQVAAHLAIACGLFLLGSVVGRFRFVPAGLSVIAAAWLVGITIALTIGVHSSGPLLLSATIVALISASIGTREYVSFLAPAGLLGVLGAIWWIVQQSSADATLASAVAGIVAVFALGTAPRFATVLAGLNDLDDDQRQGRHGSRPQALQAFYRAHRTIAGCALVSAIATSAAAMSISWSAERAPWSLLLATALIGSTVFRGLSLPLFWQRTAVYALSAWGFVGTIASISSEEQLPAVFLIPVAVGLLLLVASQAVVREQTAARLRQLAARTESVCVLSTIPLTLGLAGAYAQLGKTFG